uniref:WD repeat domain 31 n=1 Tax=Paramormyrops kingsleyae TaxID=1676925 RepID=A0A3B3R7W1_9TELE
MGKLQSKIRRRSDLYRATRGEVPESGPITAIAQYDPAHCDTINCITTLDCDLSVSGGSDHAVVVYDWRAGRLCQAFHGHSREVTKVTHVCWVPGTHSIVQTSEDKAIRVWDSRSWQVANTFPAKQYIQTHCDVSSSSHYLLSSSNGFGGHGCEATLWDLRQPGCKVVEYRGHLQTTACCVFLPATPGAPHMVATSSHDCSVKIWDQNTAACLCSLTLDGSGPLVSLAPCEVGSLLCASFNTGIHLLHLSLSAGPELREAARF